MKINLAELLDGSASFLVGLAPGAVGATVAVVLDRAMTWTQRFIAIGVGIVVSYFARGGAGAMVGNDFIVQGIAFTAGMVAYKAAPKFIDQASDVIASIPGRLRDRFLPEKKDG